ncbi:hypothetical protein HYU21_02800 [Candidatus Woesearchaeota archaeon]|nr:hypothetical protein [Candidatus Woesearchaeota archaeon]
MAAEEPIVNHKTEVTLENLINSTKVVVNGQKSIRKYVLILYEGDDSTAPESLLNRLDKEKITCFVIPKTDYIEEKSRPQDYKQNYYLVDISMLNVV